MKNVIFDHFDFFFKETCFTQYNSITFVSEHLLTLSTNRMNGKYCFGNPLIVDWLTAL